MAFFVPFDDDPMAAGAGASGAGLVADTSALSVPSTFGPSALEQATLRTIASHHYEAEDGHGAAVARLGWLKQQLLLSAAHASVGVGEGDLSALDSLPPSVTAALVAVAGRARGQQEQNAELLMEARRSRAEVERLMSERGAMFERVASAEADRAAADSLLASLRAEHKAQERRWGEEKGQLQRQLTQLAWKDATVKAQLKRKDMEYERLQKQLKLPPAAASSAVVGGRERKGGVKSIEITATKLLPASVASLSGASAGGDEAGRLGLAAADRRQQALLSENQELRETLRCLYAEVKGLQGRFDELVGEVESARARARAEVEAALAAAISAAEGAAATAATVASSGALGDAAEDAAVLGALREKEMEEEFDHAKFQMPADWLVRVVGEGLRAEMGELGARFEALGALLCEKQPEEDEEEGEGVVAGSGAGEEGQEVAAAREAQRRLASEVEALRARLASTEAVVRQQDRVIRTALFEEPVALGSAGTGRRSAAGTPLSSSKPGTAATRQHQQRRRLSDSWAAEEREGRLRGTAALEQEQAAAFAAAEGLKAQLLDADAWIAGAGAGAGAAGGGGSGGGGGGGVGTPQGKDKSAPTTVIVTAAAAKRTPLRAVSTNSNQSSPTPAAATATTATPAATAAALLSPLLQARLDLAALQKAGTPPVPPQKQLTPRQPEESPSAAAARAAIKGLAAAMGEMDEDAAGPGAEGASLAVASLQEALGFLSPIKLAEE